MLILVKCPSCTKSFRAAEQAKGKEIPCPQCDKPAKIEGPLVSPYDVFISYSSKDKAITFLKYEKGKAVYELTSGTFEFTATLK